MSHAFVALMFAIVVLTYVTHPEETHRKPREEYRPEFVSASRGRHA